jgi:hypothetical protein
MKREREEYKMYIGAAHNTPVAYPGILFQRTERKGIGGQ